MRPAMKHYALCATSLTLIFLLWSLLRTERHLSAERHTKVTSQRQWSRRVDVMFDYFVDQSVASYLNMLQHCVREMGAEKFEVVGVHKKESKTGITGTPRVPSFCSARGVQCRLVVHHKRTLLVFLSPTSFPRPPDDVIPLGFDVYNRLHTRVPMTYKDGYDVTMTYLPVVHAAADALLVQRRARTRTTPFVLPYFCAGREMAPPASVPFTASYALFPSSSRRFSEYFMETFLEASAALEVAVNLEHLAYVYNQTSSSQPISSNIKGIVFPDSHIPQEVLNYFYCLNIPVFVPAVDLHYVWKNGTEDQRSIIQHCGRSDTKLHTDINAFKAFPQVITYSCYYDLIERLAETDTSKVRLRIWKENQRKSKQIKDIILNLKDNIK